MNVRFLLMFLFLLPMSVAALSHANADPAAALREAQTLSQQGEYDKAVDVLKDAQTKNPQAAEIHLAIARNLSWKGDYQSAQNELDKIDAAQRNNPDVTLAQANLYYYQKKFKEAENLFSKILKNDPDYKDAETGLNNVRRALSSPEGGAFSWQLDTGFEVSNFSRANQDNWDQEFFRLSRFLNDGKTVLHGAITRYDQFDDIDSEYEIGINQIFSPRFSGYLSGAISPDALFRPDWRIAIGGAVRVDSAAAEGWPIWLTLDTHRDTYAATQILNITPGLRIEPRDGWAVSARIITVSQRNEKNLYGQEFRLNGRITDKWKFIAGYADAPETQAGVTVNTKTLYGGVAVDIDPAHTLRFGYTRDDREGSYIRNMYHVSVSYRF